MTARTLRKNSRLDGLSNVSIRSVAGAVSALERGRVDEATRQIIALLAASPNHPEVLRLFAALQTLQGDLAGAVSSLKQAVLLRPDDAQYLNALGSALIETYRYDEAVDTLTQACQLNPQLATAWFNLGLAQYRSMRMSESAQALQKAVALAPDQWGARVILGDLLKAEGRIDEAIAEYDLVLAQRPHDGMAWWGLANIKTRRMAETDIARLRKALDRPGASDIDIVAMGFALARALDDAGRYEASLGAIARANSRARRRPRWNAGEHSAHVDRMLSAFTPPPTGAAEPLGKEVIFVVGMPRSGSTLVEQILASSSHVEGAGELPDLPQIFMAESQRRGKPLPAWAATLKPDDWSALGRRYLERTAHWRKQRPRSTDKLPSNWFYVGAIRAMLPEARIVIVRRDPLETCFSCYRQYFLDNDYTRSFEDLAAFWRDFDRMARYWCDAHPSHVFESHYEELTTRPEATIRTLLERCDLPIERACFESHKTIRPIHTPSACQVRESLRFNTARAEQYGDLLSPLRSALAKAQSKFTSLS